MFRAQQEIENDINELISATSTLTIKAVQWFLGKKTQKELDAPSSTEIPGTPLTSTIDRLNSFADEGNIRSFTLILNKIMSKNLPVTIFNPNDYILKLLTNIMNINSSSVIHLSHLLYQFLKLTVHKRICGSCLCAHIKYMLTQASP